MAEINQSKPTGSVDQVWKTNEAQARGNVNASQVDGMLQKVLADGLQPSELHEAAKLVERLRHSGPHRVFTTDTDKQAHEQKLEAAESLNANLQDRAFADAQLRKAVQIVGAPPKNGTPEQLRDYYDQVIQAGQGLGLFQLPPTPGLADKAEGTHAMAQQWTNEGRGDAFRMAVQALGHLVTQQFPGSSAHRADAVAAAYEASANRFFVHCADSDLRDQAGHRYSAMPFDQLGTGYQVDWADLFTMQEKGRGIIDCKGFAYFAHELAKGAGLPYRKFEADDPTDPGGVHVSRHEMAIIDVGDTPVGISNGTARPLPKESSDGFAAAINRYAQQTGGARLWVDVARIPPPAP